MSGLRLSVLGCLLFAKAMALYNGNPSLPMMPESGFFIGSDMFVGAKVGYLGDYIYDTPLKIRAQDSSGKGTHRYTSLAHLGLLTLNLGDRAELFGSVGIQDSTLKGSQVGNLPISYSSNASLAWGVGGRAIIAYWGEIQLAASASYLKSLPTLSSFKRGDRSYSANSSDANIRSWQIGLGTSYRFCLGVPYAGISYTQFKTTLSHLRHLSLPIPLQALSFKNKNPLGLFVGIGLGLQKGFDLNVETRLFSEYGASVSAAVKF